MCDAGYFRSLQKRFRVRLGEAKRRRWRQQCLAETCPECGERYFRVCAYCLQPAKKGIGCCWDRSTICCCTVLPSGERLVRLIRLVAGINPATRPSRPVHDEDRWFAGPAGPRGCGPGSWDNAVRACEGG